MAGALVALAEQLQGICLGRRMTVALAESCTGGLIASTLTAVAGSSGYFLGGVVSYSNAAKESFLDVPRTTLEAHGAVSAQVAKAMAAGTRRGFGAHLGLGITGIAGPDGGSEDKPVGLTYLALADETGADVRRFTFEGDRASSREAGTRAAIEWLIERAETSKAPSEGRP